MEKTLNLIRRAKPLLGTFVEIGLGTEGNSGENLADYEALFVKAFTAIAHIHYLMSIHSASSDASAINRAPPTVWVTCAPETITVLSFAQELSERSDGMFDVCAQHTSGKMHDLEVDTINFRVKKHRPLAVNLGGIAKGFAVDFAVAAMQCGRSNISAERDSFRLSGYVNAGGDCRAFGNAQMPLLARSPWALDQPQRLTNLNYLSNASAASSANYPTVRSSIRNGTTKSRAITQALATVVAPHCMTADALTKIVLASNDAEHPLLNAYGANAWLMRAPIEARAHA